MTREVVQVVQIDQPFCTRIHGQAPCTAVAAEGLECFNTRSTCQDSENFELGALTLSFTKSDVGSRHVPDLGRSIPSLVSVSTQPAQVNLAGASPDVQGLGLRAVVTITFREHPFSDRVVDPYRATRGYDAEQQPGGFWSKWIQRNRYRKNAVVRVYDGKIGQRLNEMTMRQYFIENVSGPDASGVVTVTAMDILAKAEERKAVAPVLSPGELYEDITETQTTLIVAAAILTDYPTPGTVRIDDELMTYTTATLVDDRVELSGITRQTDGTERTTHSAETRVQWCERIELQTVDAIVELLLSKYALIETSWMDLTNWSTEVQAFLSSYRLSRVLSEPTSVIELLSQLQVQVQFYIWWDERTKLIKLKSIRGIENQLNSISEDNNIVRDSVSILYKPRERVSQVWIYYGLRNQTIDEDETANYSNGYIIADIASELDEQYGEKSIKDIKSIWLLSAAQAAATATRISRRYRDVSRQITFDLDDKDSELGIGDGIQIKHKSDVDDFGGYKLSNWTIVSYDPIMPGERTRYIAEDTTSYGVVYYIMPDGSSPYPGPDDKPFRNLYIGDADGLLSDGSECGRIS